MSGIAMIHNPAAMWETATPSPSHMDSHRDMVIDLSPIPLPTMVSEKRVPEMGDNVNTMPDFSPITVCETPDCPRREGDSASSPSIVMATPSEGSHHKTPHKVSQHSEHQYKTPTTRLHMLHALRNNSPTFKTPSSGRSNYSSRMLTPHTPSSAYSTPSSLRGRRNVYNPFDSFDHLSQPIVSPSMFNTKSALSDQSPGPFHWSIEHIAELNPADIDEMPLYQMHPHTDAEKEERAQLAIDRFFAHHQVVPSPWTDDKKRPVFTLPHTPKSPASCDNMLLSPDGNSQKNQQSSSSKLKKNDAAVQTMLSLPVEFDIKNVLGEYMTEKEEKSASQPDLSSSSLRRKLFFHGDVGTPLSPVRTGNFDITPPVSPVKCTTPQRSSDHKSYHTPGSGQFSSSPIGGAVMSSGLRRCSTAPDLASSPPVSPIRGLQEGERTPFLERLRGQATPSTGGPSVPVGSPGMSPIHTPMDGDGSYVESSQDHSTSRHLGARRKVCRKLTERMPVPTELLPSSSPIKSSPVYHCVSSSSPIKSSLVYHCVSDPGDASQMEVEDELPRGPHDKRASMSLPTYFLQEPVDGSDNVSLSTSHHVRFTFPQTLLNASELSQDTISQTQGFYSQDTGYQSLQTTNHEGLHTNLTSQFNSLPWVNQDECSQLDNSLTSHKPERQPIVMKEIFHGPSDEPLTHEEEVVRRAKAVLSRLGDSSRAESLHMSQDEDEGLPAEHDLTHGEQALVPLYPWQPLLATPQRHKFQQLGIMTDKTAVKIKPSEVAERVLWRASEDYTRYCEQEEQDMCETPTSRTSSWHHTPSTTASDNSHF